MFFVLVLNMVAEMPDQLHPPHSHNPVGVGHYIIMVIFHQWALAITSSWLFSTRYFTECAPAITFTLLPLFLLGVWFSSPAQRVFFYVGVWLLVSYSILGHKELRYIMALLPIASVYAGEGREV